MQNFGHPVPFNGLPCRYWIGAIENSPHEIKVKMLGGVCCGLMRTIGTGSYSGRGARGRDILLWVFQGNEIVYRCVNVRLHVAKPDVWLLLWCF